MKLFFDDQYIRGDGTPDLRLDGVLAPAQETLDAQVLLNMILMKNAIQSGNDPDGTSIKIGIFDMCIMYIYSGSLQ